MPLPRPRAIPVEEPTSKGRSSFFKRRSVRIVFWSLFWVHLLGLLVGSYAIAFPNPFKVFRKYGTPEKVGLTPREITTTDDVPLWLFEGHDQSKRIVLVCHGRSHNRSYMLPLIKALVPEENVAAMEFSRHGGRGYGTTSIGWFEEKEVGAALAELERRGYEQVVIYGVSMGGAAAVHHLAKQPESIVTGLATDGVFANLGEMIRGNASAYFVPGYMTSACLWLAGTIVGYDPDRFRPEEDAAAVEVPYLVLHGDQDPLVPSSHAERLARAAGENATLVIYEGGHDHPESNVMQKELLAWLRGL